MRYPRAIGLLLPAMLAALTAGACGGDDSNGGAAAKAGTLAAVEKRGVVRAGIRFDNPPHSFIDDDGNWVGFDVDIAEAVARQLGVRLERVRVDELTRISFLQNGKIDIAVASMSHTHEREAEVDFSQTYFWSKQTFLVRKGEIAALEDLVGKPVGMDRGSSAIGNWRDWLKANGHDAASEVVEFDEKQAAVEAVRQGAIAGWAEDYEILASFAKRDPSLSVLGDESIGLKLDGIGVRENDSEMRDAINAALQRIWSSGDYERIYDRWFGPRADTPVPLQGAVEVWPRG
jgi:polar amino acid transport system substrate-binding protein